MTSNDANLSFRSASENAQKAIDLYAKPIGLGARHSTEHQGIQALAEAIRDLADGLTAMTARDER
jgi:hypothetical protein